MRSPAWLIFPALLLLFSFLLLPAAQDALAPRVARLETQVMWQETRIVYLESWHPTVEFGSVTPTPTLPPPSPTATAVATVTSDPWQLACIRRNVSNLYVRSSPGGGILGKLPGGTYVRYLPASETRALGFAYVLLDGSGLVGNNEEWVAKEYLVDLERGQPCPTA
ncbi:MAG: hypothetical protein AMXMBFR13_48790 [Phycisphaerae bacterium]